MTYDMNDVHPQIATGWHLREDHHDLQAGDD